MKKDLGQAAIASLLAPVRNKDVNYSFAFSLTSSMKKLKDDCQRCKEVGHVFDVLVFTVWGEVTNGERKRWQEMVKDTYGWVLEIHDMNFLLDEAERNENENLIADELDVKRSEVFLFEEKSDNASLLSQLSPQSKIHFCLREDFNHLEMYPH